MTLLIMLVLKIPLGICAAGNIHAGHFIGANKPAEAKNVTKVFFTVAGINQFAMINSLRIILIFEFGLKYWPLLLVLL